MSAKRYLAAMLFLPLVLPLSIYVVGENIITALLFLSLGFSGFPYLIFVLLILFWMRDRNASSMHKLLYFLPLLFVPVQTIYLIAKHIVDRISNPDLGGLGGSILVSSVYIVIIGYSYTLLVSGSYMGLLKANVLKEPKGTGHH